MRLIRNSFSSGFIAVVHPRMHEKTDGFTSSKRRRLRTVHISFRYGFEAAMCPMLLKGIAAFDGVFLDLEQARETTLTPVVVPPVKHKLNPDAAAFVPQACSAPSLCQGNEKVTISIASLLEDYGDCGLDDLDYHAPQEEVVPVAAPKGLAQPCEKLESYKKLIEERAKQKVEEAVQRQKKRANGTAYVGNCAPPQLPISVINPFLPVSFLTESLEELEQAVNSLRVDLQQLTDSAVDGDADDESFEEQLALQEAASYRAHLLAPLRQLQDHRPELLSSCQDLFNARDVQRVAGLVDNLLRAFGENDVLQQGIECLSSEHLDSCMRDVMCQTLRLLDFRRVTYSPAQVVP